MKGNAQKADNCCSDGEKSYIISAGNKSLKCDVGNGYPEWVNADNA